MTTEEDNVVHSGISLRYQLIKDPVHNVLSQDDVCDFSCCITKVFDEVLMHVKVISHWEARLQGEKVVTRPHLHRSQGYSRATMNSMEGDLLSAHRDVMDSVDEQGSSSIDNRCGCVGRLLKIL